MGFNSAIKGLIYVICKGRFVNCTVHFQHKGRLFRVDCLIFPQRTQCY